MMRVKIQMTDEYFVGDDPSEQKTVTHIDYEYNGKRAYLDTREYDGNGPDNFYRVISETFWADEILRQTVPEAETFEDFFVEMRNMLIRSISPGCDWVESDDGSEVIAGHYLFYTGRRRDDGTTDTSREWCLKIPTQEYLH